MVMILVIWNFAKTDFIAYGFHRDHPLAWELGSDCMMPISSWMIELNRLKYSNNKQNLEIWRVILALYLTLKYRFKN